MSAPTLVPLGKEKEIIRIKVEFGPILAKNGDLTGTLRKEVARATGFYRVLLERAVAVLEERKRAGKPVQREYQCAYYGCGSCSFDPNQMQVCCWFDNDPNPICSCDPC
jgi:hypothetical protein